MYLFIYQCSLEVLGGSIFEVGLCGCDHCLNVQNYQFKVRYTKYTYIHQCISHTFDRSKN